MDNAHGPDISFWQDDNTTPQGVDFEKMKSVSDFVVIRAGQNYWIDPDFYQNWPAAKAAEIPRASYWYYDSRSKPKDQARWWFEALDGDYGELPLWADYEAERYGGAYGKYTHLLEFLQELERLMPEKEIGIYTGFYAWKERVPSDARYQFSSYPLWIARYGASSPLIPEPWKGQNPEWLFWQYTDKGDGPAYGVESLGIDLNHYNGTLEEFNERFDLGDEPPPPEPPPTDITATMNGTVTLRDGVVISFVPAGEPPVPPMVDDYNPKEGLSMVQVELRTNERDVTKVYRTASFGDEKNVAQVAVMPGTTVWVAGYIEDGKFVSQCPEQRRVYKWDVEKEDFVLVNRVYNYKDPAAEANMNDVAVWLVQDEPFLKNNGKNVMWNKFYRETGKLSGKWWDGGYLKIEDIIIPGEVPPPPAGIYPIDAFDLPFQVPETGYFKYVGHDFESAYWHYKPRSDKDNLNNNEWPPTHALPDTGKGRIDRMNELSVEWQWFVRDLNWHFNPHLSEKEIADQLSIILDSYGFWTDECGYQNGFENVITGQNPGSSKGYIKVKELTCGGNIVHVLEDLNSRMVCEAFDPALPPPTVQEALEKYPYLLPEATQSTCYKDGNRRWTGVKNAKPFPHFRMADGSKTGFRFPLIGEGGTITFYRKQEGEGAVKSLELYDIENGAPYSPYMKPTPST